MHAQELDKRLTSFASRQEEIASGVSSLMSLAAADDAASDTAATLSLDAASALGRQLLQAFTMKRGGPAGGGAAAAATAAAAAAAVAAAAASAPEPATSPAPASRSLGPSVMWLDESAGSPNERAGKDP